MRSLNNSSRFDSICSSSVADSSSRISEAFIPAISDDLLTRNRIGTLDELGFDRHLEGGQAERHTRRFLVDTGHLEHDSSRLDHAHPVIDRALALAHAGFGGLGGHGLIREDANPHAATTLDV